MRILWLSHGIFPDVAEELGIPLGKGGSWLWNLFSSLRDIDPTAEFCMLSIGYREFAEIRRNHVQYHYFGQKGRFCYPYGKIPNVVQRQAKEIIAKFNPDIIHVHGTEYFLGCMEPEVYCGKPVVVSLQGILSECHVHYTGGLAPKEVWWTKMNLRLLKYGSTLYRDQTFWREGRAKQEQCILRQQMNFIGRTEWDKDCVKFYNPQARYFCCNETLREPFYNTRREPSNVRTHSIYCGAAAAYPLKGVHWLIRAIAALKSDFPDIQLRIAASQWALSSNRSLWDRLRDDAYSAYLRHLIHSLDVTDNIVALPSLDADAVAEELAKAQLFVLPSLCENSSNSLGEAMLVGTPSIATFSGGTPSILKDGLEGKLVPPYDPHALAGAIRRWFENPSEAEAVVGHARETALVRHDSMTNAKRTFDIYKDLIKLNG
jgi:glycosyltransferase involved in cell wall biosynthesis